jgi:hypothetical protein
LENQHHQHHLLQVTATYAAPPAPSVARKSNKRYTKWFSIEPNWALHQFLSKFDTTWHFNTRMFLYTYYIHVTPVTGTNMLIWKTGARRAGPNFFMCVPFSVFCVLLWKCVLYCLHRVSTKCVLYCCHQVSTKCVMYCCHRVLTKCVLYCFCCT